MKGKNEMEFRLGEYKGYDVFKISKNEIKKENCIKDTMYVISETGEMILNGEVVANVNLNEMSVEELPRSERRKYKFYSSTSGYKKGPSPAAGKRREIVTVEEVCSSQVVDPTPMDEIIDKFLADARNATVETYIKIIEIDTEMMGMA